MHCAGDERKIDSARLTLWEMTLVFVFRHLVYAEALLAGHSMSLEIGRRKVDESMLEVRSSAVCTDMQDPRQPKCPMFSITSLVLAVGSNFWRCARKR
jgi:hypothetical protein